MGLMQLMPATARRFGVTDPFDPAQNQRAGTEYLAWLYRRYGGSLPLAVAAYHAGEGNVDRYLQGRPSGVGPRTRGYVQKVLGAPLG
jgi:soluble lytic murein transglycosylase-like protein